MNCGFLDVPCYIEPLVAFFQSIWFWVQVGFWVAVAALGLWALSKVKEIAGWPGVATVAGFGIYVLGFMRGRSGESFNPLENVEPDSPDAAPSHRKPKVKVRRTAKRTPGKRVYDADTNTWVEK